MLDPTQKYECDAGEVIALHGPQTSGLWLVVLRLPDGDFDHFYVMGDGSCGNPKYNLRPARPKLHVRCWLVVWECDDGGVGRSSHSDLSDALKTARRFERQHVPVAILPIDDTLTAGDGMEEQS
jgi:hypothetical protein